MENTFKSSVFGGFKRDDVIRYIEKPRSRVSSRSSLSSRRATAFAARMQSFAISLPPPSASVTSSQSPTTLRPARRKLSKKD